MRVPVYGGQQVGAAPLPGVSDHVDRSGTYGGAIRQGLGAFNAGLQRLGAQVQRHLDIEKAKASKTWALNQSAKLTDTWVKGWSGQQAELAGAMAGTAPQATTVALPTPDASGGLLAPLGRPAVAQLSTPSVVGASPITAAAGFVQALPTGMPTQGLANLHGMDAAKASVPFLQALERERQKLAATAPNEDAKAMFLARTAGWMVARHQVVEDHVSKQIQVAHAQAQQTAVAQALADVAAHPDNSMVYAQALASADSAISAYAPDQEVATAQRQQVRQQLAATVLDNQLAAGNVDAAQAFFDTHKEELGVGHNSKGSPVDLASKYRGIIRAAVAKRTVQERANAIAASSVYRGSRWIDPEKAYAQVSAYAEGPTKTALEGAVAAEIKANHARRDQAVKEHVNLMDAIYDRSMNPRDPRLGPVREWLMNPANGGATALRKWDHSIDVERRAAKDASATDRRAQSQADRDARADFNAMPIEDQIGLDVDSYYLGRASKYGRDLIKHDQKRAIARWNRDNGASTTEIRNDVQAQVAQLGLGKEKSKQLLGAVMQWYGKKVAASKEGLEPTHKEVIQQLGYLLQYGDENTWWPDANHYRFEDEKIVPFAPSDQKSELNQTTLQQAVPIGASAPMPTTETPSGPAAETPSTTHSAAGLDLGAKPTTITIPAPLHARLVAAIQRAGIPHPNEKQVLKFYQRAKARGLIK